MIKVLFHFSDPLFYSHTIEVTDLPASKIRDRIEDFRSNKVWFMVIVEDEHSNRVFTSGRIYLKGTVESAASILERNDPKDEILHLNIASLSIQHLIHIDNNSYVFDINEDTILGENYGTN